MRASELWQKKESMFTGIISAIGEIVALASLFEPSSLSDEQYFGKKLTIRTPLGYLDDVKIGDSIALNGACMTVVKIHEDALCFDADISHESLRLTAGLERCGLVNLEKALRLGASLDGHLVTGHVDGTAQVLAFEPVGESRMLCVLIPKSFAKFCAIKGSVTLAGVSLTVNQVKDSDAGCEVTVNLIPHTCEKTLLKNLKRDDFVNFEIDPLARYCARITEVDLAMSGHHS